MTFVAGAVIWAGYTISWWAWLALTDRVPPGEPGTMWWPSIKDLVSPGRQNVAVPPRLTKAPEKTPEPVLTKDQAAEKGVSTDLYTGSGA